MSDNKFFTWGYPDPNNGYQIGLWEPVLDRFLLIVTDPEIVNDLRMVASSRYLLFPCNLSTANNYSHNLVDNLCCDGWSLSNKKDIRFSKFSQHTTSIKVENLVPVGPTDWNVDTEKSWLQFVAYCLGFVKNLKHNYGNWYPYSRFIKTLEYCYVNDVMDYYDHVELTEKFILKSLHLGYDVDLVYKNITSFIQNQDPTVFKIWNQWQDQYHA